MEVSGDLEKQFDREFARSLLFTQKLVDVFTRRFGVSVAGAAEKIVPVETRRAWAEASPDERLNIYMAKSQFEIRFLDEMEKAHGEPVAAMVSDLVAEDEFNKWKGIAEKEKSRTLDDFFRLLWVPLPFMGFEYTVEKRDNGIDAAVTRCPLHEMSKHTGGEKWLYLLACERDFHNARGFNPAIGLKRNKTLMQGDAACEFHYRMI